ncbi:hypothetical protein [Georgenia sp. SUBG003]|uniref:hypothetical protein n=1 Tax=Georgenia sp. SUBG003 TaxID=1497974 RepID=UPI003AB271A1
MEELDRVRAHTAPEINHQLDARRLEDVTSLVGATPAEFARRCAGSTRSGTSNGRSR